MAELALPAWCWVRVLGLKQEPGKAQMSQQCKHVSILITGPVLNSLMSIFSLKIACAMILVRRYQLQL